MGMYVVGLADQHERGRRRAGRDPAAPAAVASDLHPRLAGRAALRPRRTARPGPGRALRGRVLPVHPRVRRDPCTTSGVSSSPGATATSTSASDSIGTRARHRWACASSAASSRWSPTGTRSRRSSCSPGWASSGATSSTGRSSLRCPTRDRRRYALLIMLWPTMVFWPSSIGKDCWLLFTLGIASLGAAKVFARRPGGYTLLLVGLLLGSFVRPHVSLMLAIAFGVALLVGRRAERPGRAHPDAWSPRSPDWSSLLAIGGYLVDQDRRPAQHRRHQRQVDTALAANCRVAPGRGALRSTAANPQNPLGYVRGDGDDPLPPASRSRPAAPRRSSTSLEALGLLVLTVASWRRLVEIPRRLRADPYVTLAVSYTLIFFFAFGTIANFGILARERSQLMPYVFVLLSLQVLAPRTRRQPTRHRSGPCRADGAASMGDVERAARRSRRIGLPTSARRCRRSVTDDERLRQCSTDASANASSVCSGARSAPAAFPVTSSSGQRSRSSSSPGRCTVADRAGAVAGVARCSTAPGSRCGS